MGHAPTSALLHPLFFLSRKFFPSYMHGVLSLFLQFLSESFPDHSISKYNHIPNASLDLSQCIFLHSMYQCQTQHIFLPIYLVFGVFFSLKGKLQDARHFCLFCSLLYNQHLEQCLVYNRCSISIRWMNDDHIIFFCVFGPLCPWYTYEGVILWGKETQQM